MSKNKKPKNIKDSEKWKTESGEWAFVALFLMVCFSGWNVSESSRINELEKKVLRLEGQMSMIGGKNL